MTGTKNETDADLKASVTPVDLSENDMNVGEAALTREQEEVLAGCAERLAALGRRTAAQTFEYGEVLAKAQSILPPKAFGKWLEPNCGIGTKAAKNYTRVYSELAPYRARLEKNAYSSTAMFALLGAEPEQIEAVLDASDAGQRLTVQNIKELIAGPNKPEAATEVDLLNLPGRAGFMRVAQQRLKDSTALFYELLGRILPSIEEAAEKFQAGKKVAKGELIDKVVYDARHASDLFDFILAPIYRNLDAPALNWRPTSMDKKSVWGRLQKALRDMGGADSWPTKDAFRLWIVDEVCPLLKFAVRGEPLDRLERVDADAVAVEKEAMELAKRVQSDQSTPRRLDVPANDRVNVIDLETRRVAEG